jgi:hypothetical protein
MGVRVPPPAPPPLPVRERVTAGQNKASALRPPFAKESYEHTIRWPTSHRTVRGHRFMPSERYQYSRSQLPKPTQTIPNRAPRDRRFLKALRPRPRYTSVPDRASPVRPAEPAIDPSPKHHSIASAHPKRRGSPDRSSRRPKRPSRSGGRQSARRRFLQQTTALSGVRSRETD